LGLTEIIRTNQADTKLAQISWSKGFGKWGQFSLNAFTSLSGPTNHSISFGYFLPLDFTSSAGTSTTRSTSSGRSRVISNATLQRNLPPGDGYGYRLLATDRRDLIAGFTAQNNVGVYQLDVSRLNDITTTRLGVSGSLVYLGDELVAGRRADSAFALVSVPGFANVRVSLNNQEVGRTNSRGNLFVPRLRPYESNQISIDQQDLPMSAEVVTLRMDATPYLRSGLVVRFAVRESLSGIAQFVDESGIAIPAGATLSINGSPERVPVADRGEAFLTGLNAQNLIRITSGDRSCTITINYQRTDDPQPMLGVFKCKLEK
jgi:outer membrane usher protein